MFLIILNLFIYLLGGVHKYDLVQICTVQNFMENHTEMKNISSRPKFNLFMTINYKLTLIRHSYFLDKWCWAVLYWLFSDRACWLLLWNRFDENQMEDCCKSLDPSLWCMKSCPPLQHAILGLQVRHNNISFK